MLNLRKNSSTLCHLKVPQGGFRGLLLLCAIILLLPSCGVNSRIKKADAHYTIGDYYVAGDLYRKSYNRVPPKNKELRARVAFNQAECYRLLNNSRAEQAYRNAIQNNYQDSIVFLRYAQTLHQNEKYADAAKNYTIYLQHDTTDIVGKNGLKAAQSLNEWKKTPTRYKITKIKDKEFNPNRASSYSPAFMSSSGDVLVFTSMRRITSDKKKTSKKGQSITGMPMSKMFVTRKNASEKWEKPDLLPGEVNSTHDDGVCSFTSDGKTMYFTRAIQSQQSDAGTSIFVSQRAGGTWSEPQLLKIFADSTVSVAHPAISPDGQTLYFVSDSPNGYGGKDIWKAKIEGNECTYIENLGADINTSNDEMFPTVRADGTLYFSSNGHAGFGGLDIFKATIQGDNQWIVENMGTPINSQGDDFGMAFFGTTESGFFTSNRPDSRYVAKMYDALWSFELPELVYALEGKVTSSTGEAVADATVRIVGNNGVNARVQTRKDGSYRFRLEKDVDYVMMASARGYLNQKNELATHGITDSKTYAVNFTLTSISKPIQMDNIFYEFGKWDLTPDSEEGLQALVKLLNDNPNITIELSAHTDYVGNNTANVELSTKRAQSVVNYLIKAGIEADRLTAVGYGEEKPFTVDVATAKKYSFLKENDVLTEEFVLTLTPEQQATTNQINRRTEFRVLKMTYNMY